MQILSSVGAFAANTPAVDAGIGLVPGLAAMSRIINNAELDTLNSGPPLARTGYFAVVGNFQTEAAGWRFWKLFNKLKLADIAADHLVFEQDNDLVVDTKSMTYHAFGEKPEVYNNDELFCYFNETRPGSSYCLFSRAGYGRIPDTEFQIVSYHMGADQKSGFHPKFAEVHEFMIRAWPP